MSSADQRRAIQLQPLHRVLILADESANWKVAGLRQLDRLALCLEEFAVAEERPLTLQIVWSNSILPNDQWTPNETRFARLHIVGGSDDFERDDRFDLILTTRLFLYRYSVPQLRAALPNDTSAADFRQRITNFAIENSGSAPWQYLETRNQIAACERRFLAQSGKSQDGLVSRYLNRPLSRTISRLLLKTPLQPTTWSLSIFILPLIAAVFFLRGDAIGFIIGCAIFQLYSILDGCDGEIARAKFLQSESGRRVDSFCDLIGNILLVISLGVGLAWQALAVDGSGLFYLIEGIVAALLIVLSEGIVFTRRARPQTESLTKWNGALYQRHHELIERSGLLLLGEKFAWSLVQLTKRDVAMLGFLALALLGWTPWILHLQVLVAGICSALAGNAFLRPAPAALPEEAG